MCFGGEARTESTAPGQKRQRDAGPASGQAPIGQGALGAEPHLAAACVDGRSTVPMIVRFSWPVNFSAWACMVRQAGPAGTGGARAEGEPKAVVDELGVLHGETQWEAVAVDDGEVVCRRAAPPRGRRARHDAGGASHAPGCWPLGAGSDRGAAVPSGAFQVRGGSSRLAPLTTTACAAGSPRSRCARSTTPIGGARTWVGPWWRRAASPC